jgi:predicted RNA-binding Zn ribbon-like protein
VNFSHYKDAAVATAVDLVNTLDTSVDDGETLVRVRDLEQFLADHEIVTGRLCAADVEQVREVRERLRAVFLAGDGRAAAKLLNDLIGEARVHPELTDHDGEWHLHFAPESASVSRRLAASSAMSLGMVLVEFGPDRLKMCGSESCADVFVDTSRNLSRRYCGDRCANRENVAAYRARRRTSATSAGPPG